MWHIYINITVRSIACHDIETMAQCCIATEIYFFVSPYVCLSLPLTPLQAKAINDEVILSVVFSLSLTYGYVRFCTVMFIYIAESRAASEGPERRGGGGETESSSTTTYCYMRVCV